MILALESDVEEQTPIEYTQGEIAYAQLHEREVEFLKPDGQKAVGPILKMGGNTFNIKDKYTGKSFTYKYSGKIEEEKVKTFKQVSEAANMSISVTHKEGNIGQAVNKFDQWLKFSKEGPSDWKVTGSKDKVAMLQKYIDTGKLGKSSYQKWPNEENIDEVSIGPATIRKDFPNVWAQKDKRMNNILMALVNMHGYVDNLKAYKKDKKKFVDDLKKIGKNDASLKKAGLTKRNIGEWVSKSGTRRRVKDEDKRISKLKEWEKAAEATGDKAAYQKFFNSALKKFGVSSPDELEGEKKKKFFDYVDKNWKGDHEEVEIRLDGRRKNFREKMKKLGYIKGE
jgi:hypothetical protein